MPPWFPEQAREAIAAAPSPYVPPVLVDPWADDDPSPVVCASGVLSFEVGEGS